MKKLILLSGCIFFITLGYTQNEIKEKLNVSKDFFLTENSNDPYEITSQTQTSWEGSWYRKGSPTFVWKATHQSWYCYQTWGCDCGSFYQKPNCSFSKTGDQETYGVAWSSGNNIEKADVCGASWPNVKCKCKLTCPDE